MLRFQSALALCAFSIVSCNVVVPVEGTGGSTSSTGGTVNIGDSCASSCSGCCNSNRECVAGTTAALCGANGNSCTTCGGSATCQSGACSAPANKRIFITRTAYSGDLKTTAGAVNGVDGADALCQLAAQAANLSGTFVAWISTGLRPAIDHIKDVGPWYTLRNVRVFNNKANLATAPIVWNDVTDEMNATVAYGTSYWTGTTSGGRSSNNHCQNFASLTSNSFGTTGQVPAGSSSWTEEDAQTCDTKARLLCFEQ